MSAPQKNNAMAPERSVVRNVTLFMMLAKSFFKILAKINRVILPRYSKRDINALSKFDKALVAYRYWVTIHAIDDRR